MNSKTRQRILGAVGVIGCSAAVLHVLVVANAPAYYYIFYFLALLGAFVIGAAHETTEEMMDRAVRNAWEHASHYRQDGAPKDYPVPPPPPPPKTKLPGGF